MKILRKNAIYQKMVRKNLEKTYDDLEKPRSDEHSQHGHRISPHSPRRDNHRTQLISPISSHEAGRRSDELWTDRQTSLIGRASPTHLSTIDY